uniref:Uncharacterized protein n=1 Tax=Anguilla anguilla TaxID=7936 RepID=A0A0E9S238_ANGAN
MVRAGTVGGLSQCSCVTECYTQIKTSCQCDAEPHSKNSFLKAPT